MVMIVSVLIEQKSLDLRSVYPLRECSFDLLSSICFNGNLCFIHLIPYQLLIFHEFSIWTYSRWCDVFYVVIIPSCRSQTNQLIWIISSVPLSHLSRTLRLYLWGNAFWVQDQKFFPDVTVWIFSFCQIFYFLKYWFQIKS